VALIDSQGTALLPPVPASSRLFVATCALLLGLGCKDQGGGKPTPESCPPLPLGTYSYTDTLPPKATLSGDWAADKSLTMPLALEGKDNGDMSVLYGTAMMGYYMIGVQRPVTCVDKKGLPCSPFIYQYDPRTDAETAEDMIHRQIVGAFGQTWIYRVTGRKEFSLSAEAAIQMLVPRVKVSKKGTKYLHDLGATGLMIMTLTQHGKYTGDTSRDELILDLGEHVLGELREDGSFKSGSALVWIQLHNVLWRLWDYTGHEVYLDALKRVARDAYMRRNERAKGQYHENIYIYGLWALEPLTELYKIWPEPWIQTMVFLTADDVIAKQYTYQDAAKCAWVGGFKPNNGKGHPNWNHTLKLEAMADAWRFAQLVGDTERSERYKASALAGADFLLRFQHRAGETDKFPNPAKPIGGIPLGGSDPSVRIDIPGHGSVGMAKVVSYFGTETSPSAPVPPPRTPPPPRVVPSAGEPGAAPAEAPPVPATP
jgi:hypothetical protein